jgi:signal transduction histidine kinase
MPKNFHLSILLLTLTFFSITTIYWFQLKDGSENSLIFYKKINSLKFIDNEIDNALFTNNLPNEKELLEQKLKLFERELYFFRENSKFLKYLDRDIELQIFFEKIENSFSKKIGIVRKIRDKKLELKEAIFITSTMNKRADFEKLILSNSEFKEIYRDAMFHIINGGDYHKLIEIGEKIASFQELNVETIEIAIKNISYLVEISIEIELLILDVLERAVLKNLIIFENRLIEEFQTDDQSSNAIFYILILISFSFLIALTFLFQRDRKLQQQLSDLNISLVDRVEREVEKNREKDKLIFQQAKLASLGEMIGNIAHQWRQPLNNLAIVIQDIENAYHFGEIDEDYISSSSDDAMKQINYMSSTIDDFRNFFKSDEVKTKFSIHEAIANSLTISISGLNSNKINLQKDIRDECFILGSKNQYIQVVINLLKNGQDILIEREITDPRLKISLKKDGDFAIFSVEDNAGGVPENIIDKIFEPYFTTKHQSVGTGLGLYMSKMIIEKNFGGKMRVENSEVGARFILIVPLFVEQDI